MTDSMVRDQIVFGTNNDKVRETLLRNNKLTLARAEQVCKAAELSDAQNELWARERQVSPVKATPSIEPHAAQDYGRAQERHIDFARTRSSNDEPPGGFKCRKCGRRHGPRDCPAFGRTCRRCGGKDHFAVRCNNKQVSEIKSNEEDFDILDVSVDSVMRQRDWVVQAQVANKVLELKVDTGAQANLLPYCMFRRLQPRMQLRASNSVLRSYDGGVIKHLGVVKTKATICNRSADIDFFVVNKER